MLPPFRNFDDTNRLNLHTLIYMKSFFIKIVYAVYFVYIEGHTAKLVILPWFSQTTNTHEFVPLKRCVARNIIGCIKILLNTCTHFQNGQNCIYIYINKNIFIYIYIYSVRTRSSSCCMFAGHVLLSAGWLY